VNSISIKGPHLDKVKICMTENHQTDSIYMMMASGCFNFEETCLDFDFDTLASAVCDVLSPPLLDDVSDILQLDNSLESLLPGLASSADTNLNFSEMKDCFTSLCQFTLDDTFTSEDRWPI
jgi:hypothetical protein